VHLELYEAGVRTRLPARLRAAEMPDTVPQPRLFPVQGGLPHSVLLRILSQGRLSFARQRMHKAQVCDEVCTGGVQIGLRQLGTLPKRLRATPLRLELPQSKLVPQAAVPADLRATPGLLSRI